VLDYGDLNGATLCKQNWKFTIQADGCYFDTVDHVEFSVWQDGRRVYEHDENHPPYTLFGNSGLNFDGHNWYTGQIEVAATAVGVHNGEEASSGWSVTFDVIDCCNNPPLVVG